MRRVFLTLSALLLFGVVARADTLHLKDGSTVTGVIVGFDQNSFKVKTNYGFAVVRRDAVVSIDMAEGNRTAEKKPALPAPAPPAEKPTPAPAAAAIPVVPVQQTAKPAPTAAPAQPTLASASPAKPPEKTEHTQPPAAVSAGTTKVAAPPTAPAPATSASKVTAPPATATKITAPPVSAPSAVSTNAPTAGPAAPKPATASTKPPVAPKPADEPIREETSGNTYANLSYGFRMYKPPTWSVIDGARKTLPGAIAALGTEDQSTYLLIGTSPSTGSLDADLKSSDVKLRDMFDNYRPLGDARETISGANALERKFRGSIDTHEWSGVVVLFERGKQAYTVLGMTVADSDLVQIQENVIRRAISSLQFNP
jgi:hypothetical protein